MYYMISVSDEVPQPITTEVNKLLIAQVNVRQSIFYVFNHFLDCPSPGSHHHHHHHHKCEA